MKLLAILLAVILPSSVFSQSLIGNVEVARLCLSSTKMLFEFSKIAFIHRDSDDISKSAEMFARATSTLGADHKLFKIVAGPNAQTVINKLSIEDMASVIFNCRLQGNCAEIVSQSFTIIAQDMEIACEKDFRGDI